MPFMNSVGSTQFVTLKVFDILGREVVTLFNEEKPAGTYKIEFNKQQLLSNGVYFYRLTAEEKSYFQKTRKIILTK